MLPTTASKFKCPILCSILLNLFLGFTFLNAQIIYTDIEPDYTSEDSGYSYDLDLNNDGITDFAIYSTYYENYGYYMEIRADSNSVNGVISVDPMMVHPSRLDYGIEIFTIPNTNYPSYGGNIYSTIAYFFIGGGSDCNDICCCDWENRNDKYLGLKFSISGQTHYGWARMDITDETHWVIKDYAYQGIHDRSIFTGQMPPTLGNSDANSINHTKIATSNKVISVFNLSSTLEYTLFSMTGQSVLSGSVSEDNNKIDTSMLSSGLYVIELTNSQNKQTIKKKVII